MNYIVLDMEWNQSYPYGNGNRKKQIKNEIIEIGAVKLSESMEIISEFKRLVRQKFIKRLNSRVKALTGITKEMLSGGQDFPEVIEEFRDWCGDDRCILTWGCDDIPTLISCLKMYGMGWEWIGKWYNLQMIFNAQTDGGSEQRSLKSALEHFGCDFDEERPWHDAMNDACYTAIICQKLDLKRGIEEYSVKIPRAASSQKRYLEAVIGTMKEVSRVKFNCVEAKGHRRCPEAFKLNPCPLCGASMTCGLWVASGKRNEISIGECKIHGRFFLSILLPDNDSGEKTLIKTVYESNAEAEALYAKRTAGLQGGSKPRKSASGAKKRDRRGRTARARQFRTAEIPRRNEPENEIRAGNSSF